MVETRPFFDYDLFLECLEDHLVELAGSYAVRELIYTVKLSWYCPHTWSINVPVISVVREIGEEAIYTCVCFYDFASPVRDTTSLAFHNRVKELMEQKQKADCYRIRNMLFGAYATAKDCFEANFVAGLEMQKSRPVKTKVQSLMEQAGRFRSKERLPIVPIQQGASMKYQRNELFEN